MLSLLLPLQLPLALDLLEGRDGAGLVATCRLLPFWHIFQQLRPKHLVQRLWLWVQHDALFPLLLLHCLARDPMIVLVDLVLPVVVARSALGREILPRDRRRWVLDVSLCHLHLLAHLLLKSQLVLCHQPFQSGCVLFKLSDALDDAIVVEALNLEMLRLSFDDALPADSMTTWKHQRHLDLGVEQQATEEALVSGLRQVWAPFLARSQI